jgi:hypothetical protein
MLGLRTMFHIACVKMPGRYKPIVIFYWCEDKKFLNLNDGNIYQQHYVNRVTAEQIASGLKFLN